eukprot:1152549-Pelagomonas_calceolata.AAC.5
MPKSWKATCKQQTNNACTIVKAADTMFMTQWCVNSGMEGGGCRMEGGKGFGVPPASSNHMLPMANKHM